MRLEISVRSPFEPSTFGIWSTHHLSQKGTDNIVAVFKVKLVADLTAEQAFEYERSKI